MAQITQVRNGIYVALKNDGTVWMWGCEYQDQHIESGGIYDITSIQAPIQVPGLNNVVSLGHWMHGAVALKNDGTVWMWGYEHQYRRTENGEIRNITSIQAPIQVPGLDNVVSLGYWTHGAVVLKNDGTVWMCGCEFQDKRTENGEIRNVISIQAPIQVPGLDNVVAVVSFVEGWMHRTFALKNDGTVWMWGFEEQGQGTVNGVTVNGVIYDFTYNFTSIQTPIQVPGLNNVVSLGRSDLGAFALKNDGTVWMWGYEIQEQRTADSGTLTVASIQIPIQVPGLSDVVSLGRSKRGAFALKNDGTVWMWWYLYQGWSTGNGWIGSIPSIQTPIQVPGLSDVVSFGMIHTTALKNDGTVWLWGYEYQYQFTENNQTSNITSIQTPIQVPGLSDVKR